MKKKRVVSQEPIQAAVIGHPVSHSLSPDIFSYIAKQTGVPIQYSKLDINPQDFDAVVDSVKVNPSYIGWNVTIPYKQSILKHADRPSKEVKSVGAANVVCFRSGKIFTYNTDVFGIQKTLSENKVKVKSKVCVLFGAGGAAKAVLYALHLEGIKKLYLYNRSYERALQLREEFKSKHPRSFQFEVLKDLSQVETVPEPIALYINSTPLGMEGFPQVSILPRGVSKKSVAFDLIYRPTKTPFLLDARRAKMKTIGGIDMLIWQAIATWEIWFGKMSSRSQTKNRLKSMLLRKHI